MNTIEKFIRQDGIAVVRPKGYLDLNEGAHLLRQTIKELTAEGRHRIVLDLSGVTYADSSGIGELVSTLTSARVKGGGVVLVGLPPKLVEILTLQKLIQVFKLSDSVDQAAAHLLGES